MTGSDLSRAGAPALSVRGLGPAEVTVAGLSAGGGALLLFVSQECPTSAMALRRLGPLCGAWQEAGLTAIAVFEDPLEVAVRVARRLGWQAGVAAEDPPYRTSRAYRLVSVPTAVLVDRAGTIAGTVTGWDHAALVALIGRAGAFLGAGLAIPEAAEPLLKPGCSSKAAIDPELAAAMSVPAGTDDVEEMFERGWTDGLPVVPPTPDRVEAMLGGCDGRVSLGPVPPDMGEATLERVAACAVLAGCRPAYFPVVVAAAQAALDPAFNLHGQAVTTQPAGQLVVVNGPVREAIGLNSGMGALGPGFRANLTIGRALRLLDAARRDEKLTGPERDITVSHLDGDLSADDREELAGYRSGRCQLNSPWTCTIRASLLIDFVIFVPRPVELTVQNRTLPYGLGATLES